MIICNENKTTVEMSESIVELAAALAKAQTGYKPIIREKFNPFFRSYYADLTQIIDSTRDALAANGLAIVQFLSGDETCTVVTTRLIHASGQWMQSSVSCKPIKSDPQGMGGVCSYLRRYAMSAMLSLSSEMDDDGNDASVIDAKLAEKLDAAIGDDEAMRAQILTRYKSLDKIPLTDYEKVYTYVKKGVRS